MKTFFRKMLAIVGLVAFGVLVARTANAQCNPAAFRYESQLQKQSWSGAPGVRLRAVDWRRDDDDDDIVGFWNITLTSRGTSGIPDGTILDKGLQQWHADGTEFLNSSGQHPLTQNYCMGVWKKVEALYLLNHFAYNYDVSQTLIGLTSIREEIRLDRGGSTFTGQFWIQGYDTLRHESGPLIKGDVKGKRIEITTKPENIL